MLHLICSRSNIWKGLGAKGLRSGKSGSHGFVVSALFARSQHRICLAYFGMILLVGVSQPDRSGISEGRGQAARTLFPQVRHGNHWWSTVQQLRLLCSVRSAVVFVQAQVGCCRPFHMDCFIHAVFTVSVGRIIPNRPIEACSLTSVLKTLANPPSELMTMCMWVRRPTVKAACLKGTRVHVKSNEWSPCAFQTPILLKRF